MHSLPLATAQRECSFGSGALQSQQRKTKPGYFPILCILQGSLFPFLLFERVIFLLAVPIAMFQNLGCLETKPGNNRGKKTGNSLLVLLLSFNFLPDLSAIIYFSESLVSLCIRFRILLQSLGEIEQSMLMPFNQSWNLYF